MRLTLKIGLSTSLNTAMRKNLIFKNSGPQFNRYIALFSLFNFAVASTGFSGESLFGRVYTTETMPKGHFETEQILRNRSERSFGHYSAFDGRTELEYGISDNFQGAFYVNTGYVGASGAPDDDAVGPGTSFSQNQFYLQGFSLEFIYRVMSPFVDPIGLAFYVEPEVSFYDFHNGMKYSGTYGVEYRLLLQKNFFDDQLVLAYNMVAETELIRFADVEGTRTELDWNHEIGLSYRFAANWFAGFEARNHNEYGDFSTHEHTVFWAGPVVHYGAPKFWATVSVMRQIYGDPNNIDPDTGSLIGNDLFLRSHENWEATAKVGIPL